MATDTGLMRANLCYCSNHSSPCLPGVLACLGGPGPVLSTYKPPVLPGTAVRQLSSDQPQGKNPDSDFIYIQILARPGAYSPSSCSHIRLPQPFLFNPALFFPSLSPSLRPAISLPPALLEPCEPPSHSTNTQPSPTPTSGPLVPRAPRAAARQSSWASSPSLPPPLSPQCSIPVSLRQGWFPFSSPPRGDIPCRPWLPSRPLPRGSGCGCVALRLV